MGSATAVAQPSSPYRSFRSWSQLLVRKIRDVDRDVLLYNLTGKQQLAITVRSGPEASKPNREVAAKL
jgi:hypothetical protein